MNTNRKALRRLTWILFGDLNSRFNTLIEECAHLQNTLVALLPNEVKRKAGVFPGHGKPNGGRSERQWQSGGISFDDLKRYEGFKQSLDEDFLSLKPSTKTYLQLIDALGAVVRSLTENQSECRESYLTFVDAYSAEQGFIENDTFFRFVSKRAYFIGQGFDHYTQYLEHAHEKLVQILETNPSCVPQPALLRRWNSAMYEKYLSDYYRQIRWELSNILGMVKDDQNDDSDDNLTHSWTHSPTSTVLLFNVPRPSQPRELKDCYETRNQNFGSIFSAFFYLEQPVLFPLLYHECGHFVIDHARRLLRERRESSATASARQPDCDPSDTRYATFLGAMDQTVAELYDAWPTNLTQLDADVIEDVVREVWIDALSVLAGHTSYLAALTLQVVGESPVRYSDTTIPGDSLAIMRFGGEALRYRSSVSHGLRTGDFWEARLCIAWRLCRKIEMLSGTQSGKIGQEATEQCAGAERPLLKEWLDAFPILLGEWHKSGKRHFERMQPEHAEDWHRRVGRNEWFQDIVWKHLDKAVDRLKLDVPEPNDAAKLPRAVSKTVEHYFASVWRWKDVSGRCNGELTGAIAGIDKLNGIEEAPLAVRWVVSLAQDEMMKTISASERRDVLDAFASYVRHDGNTVFRIALEWVQAQESLFRYAADLMHGLEQGADLPLLACSRATNENGGVNHASAAAKYLAESDPVRDCLVLLGVAPDQSTSGSAGLDADRKQPNDQVTCDRSYDDIDLLADAIQAAYDKSPKGDGQNGDGRNENRRDSFVNVMSELYRRQYRKWSRDFELKGGNANGPHCCNLRRLVSLLIQRILSSSIEPALEPPPDDSPRKHFGTAVLGLVRPIEYSGHEYKHLDKDASGELTGHLQNASDFLNAYRRVRRFAQSRIDGLNDKSKKFITWLEAQSKQKRNERSGISDETGKGLFSVGFVPLVGDYSYFSIAEGRTPVERDFHPEGHPRVLAKRRAVIQVAGSQSLSDISRGPTGDATDGSLVDQTKKIGKLTLIRFGYRFEWIRLKQWIDKRKTTQIDGNVSDLLYLSSGWEDAILLSWHDSLEDMLRCRIESGMISDGEKEVDAQSSLVFSIDRLPKTVDTDKWAHKETWSDRFQHTWAEFAFFRESKTKEPGYIDVKCFEVMGRYDYTIRWPYSITVVGQVDELIGELYCGLASYGGEMIGRRVAGIRELRDAIKRAAAIQGSGDELRLQQLDVLVEALKENKERLWVNGGNYNDRQLDLVSKVLALKLNALAEAVATLNDSQGKCLLGEPSKEDSMCKCKRHCGKQGVLTGDGTLPLYTPQWLAEQFCKLPSEFWMPVDSCSTAMFSRQTREQCPNNDHIENRMDRIQFLTRIVLERAPRRQPH